MNNRWPYKIYKFLLKIDQFILKYIKGEKWIMRGDHPEDGNVLWRKHFFDKKTQEIVKQFNLTKIK